MHIPMQERMIGMKRCYAMALLAAMLFTGCQNIITITDSDSETNAAPELLGLEWYSSIGTAEKIMSAYRLDDRSEEAAWGGQLQTLLEYDDVPLYETPCDVTLCFTSLGLIGINYHDDDGSYTAWKERLTEKFGAPSEESDDTIMWENPPLAGTMSAYVFQWEDDVQISFFADDTGSETQPPTEFQTETGTETAEITEAWAADGEMSEEIPAVNGLMFHADAKRTKAVMGGELTAERPMDDQFGNVLELDYEQAQLYDKTCKLTLCFTHRGLARIRYFDAAATMKEWVETLKADYGEPSRSSENFVIWENSPLGEHTSIIVDDREEIGCVRVMFNCNCW